MTDELRKFLNSNIELLQMEQYRQLQMDCSGELRKELKLLLLDCSGNDTEIIVQSMLAETLQYQIDKSGVDAFVIHLVMYQPHKYPGDRYVGEFSYIILMNNKIYDDVFEYDVIAPKLPRATAILEECGSRFAQHIKEVHND